MCSFSSFGIHAVFGTVQSAFIISKKTLMTYQCQIFLGMTKLHGIQARVKSILLHQCVMGPQLHDVQS